MDRKRYIKQATKKIIQDAIKVQKIDTDKWPEYKEYYCYLDKVYVRRACFYGLEGRTAYAPPSIKKFLKFPEQSDIPPSLREKDFIRCLSKGRGKRSHDFIYGVSLNYLLREMNSVRYVDLRIPITTPGDIVLAFYEALRDRCPGRELIRGIDEPDYESFVNSVFSKARKYHDPAERDSFIENQFRERGEFYKIPSSAKNERTLAKSANLSVAMRNRTRGPAIPQDMIRFLKKWAVRYLKAEPAHYTKGDVARQVQKDFEGEEGKHHDWPKKLTLRQIIRLLPPQRKLLRQAGR